MPNIPLQQNLGKNLSLMAGLIIEALKRRSNINQVDQARQGAMAGTPVDILSRNTGMGVASVPNFAGANPQAGLGEPQLDNAKFIQALLPLIARGNPNAQTAFQTQMALKPETFTGAPGAGIYQKDYLGNVKNVGQVPDRTQEDKMIAQARSDLGTSNLTEDTVASLNDYIKKRESGDRTTPYPRIRTSTAVGGYGVNPEDPKDIAKGIKEGRIPPDPSKYGNRYSAPIAAELSRMGYDLSTANRDWVAMTKYIASLNGPQQVRMRQAVELSAEMLPNIESLYNRLKSKSLQGTGFKMWNKAAMLAAKNLPGETGAIATNLEAQIADFVADLGVVYRGGNASTDESLQLAAKNLQGDWNPETFNMALKQVSKNLQMRRNSIVNAGIIGISPNSPYTPPPIYPQGGQPDSTNKDLRSIFGNQ